MSNATPARPWLPLLLALPAIAMPADVASPSPLPDEEFLEYLGTWAADDEDWLVAASPVPIPASGAGVASDGQPKHGGGEGAGNPSQEQVK